MTQLWIAPALPINASVAKLENNIIIGISGFGNAKISIPTANAKPLVATLARKTITLSAAKHLDFVTPKTNIGVYVADAHYV